VQRYAQRVPSKWYWRREDKEKNMEPMVKTKNVGRAEAILRSVIGIILIIFAFSIEGILRWVVGLIGVIFILTAIFGY